MIWLEFPVAAKLAALEVELGVFTGAGAGRP